MAKKSRYSIVSGVVIVCMILAPAQVWKNMHVARMSSSGTISAPMQPREPAPQAKKASFIVLVGLGQRSGLKRSESR
jgi:hypothetical protein